MEFSAVLSFHLSLGLKFIDFGLSERESDPLSLYEHKIRVMQRGSFYRPTDQSLALA